MPAESNIQRRFDRIGNVLSRIHVLARAGDSELALVDLQSHWPEMDAVFSAGPEYLFNPVQRARALALRAGVDGDATASGSGSNAPPVTSGPRLPPQLTRYEREVLLAGIETRLGTATVAVLPAAR